MLDKVFPRLLSFDPRDYVRGKTELLPAEQCRAAVEYLDGSAEPMGMAAANEFVAAILKQYPRSDVEEPVGYSASLVAVLSDYPEGVGRRLADARTGCFIRFKFLPRGPEWKDACESELLRRTTMRHWANWMLKQHSTAQPSVARKSLALADNPRMAERTRDLIRTAVKTA